MDKKIAVIYQSIHGTTKKYAEWIDEELGAELIARKAAAAAELDKYDVVIYGGGLYGPRGIAGSGLVSKKKLKHLVVFTVGLADPDITDYSDILKRNFPNADIQPEKVFHLRGGIDYEKLSLVHRGMMAMLKRITINKKPKEEWSAEDKLFAETYGGNIDFVDRNSITPIVEYVKACPGAEA
ncbi:MAG: flavodoxin [Treponematales bacterium]|jgi:menaquinone-dependent protoporphyrinogen IX oxidase